MNAGTHPQEDSSLLIEKSRWRLLSAAAAAMAAAVAFVALAAPRLTAQGPYQDELHQAAPAFCYLGSPPEQGINLEIGGIPVLNTSYSGAVKTAMYGLYLRFVEPRFSLFSWRLLGILLVAGALGIFVWMVRRALSPPAVGLFLFLFLTDATVLLAVRHDWGPVALALALRLVFIALWLSGEADDGMISRKNSFALGCVTGIAVFEKLSSIVLLWPLALIFTFGPHRRRWRHWLAATAGLATGLLPLLLINSYSWVEKGRLSSLESMAATSPPEDWNSLLQYARIYLEMGSGRHVRTFILGRSPTWTDSWELLLLPLLAVGLILLVLQAGKGDPAIRWAGVALASYVGIATAMKLIPRPTWVHHWILGTPWQYLTVALIAGGLRLRGSVKVKAASLAAAAILAVWLPVRIAGLVHLQQQLYQAKASDAWSPELTKLGEFASDQCGKARFIAVTWGLAYQIYAFSNGCPRITRELFWDYQGPDHLREILAASPASDIYLVGRPGNRINVENEKRIEKDLRALPDWMEVPASPPVASLKTIRVVRFSPR